VFDVFLLVLSDGLVIAEQKVQYLCRRRRKSFKRVQVHGMIIRL